MRQYVLFDSEQHYADLLPLSFTRPLSDFRVGTLTLRQKWEKRLMGEFFYQPVEYLTTKFGRTPADATDLTFIAGNLVASDELARQIEGLAMGEAICAADDVLAFRGSRADFEARLFSRRIEAGEGVARICFPFDVFLLNGAEIRADFALLTAGRKSQPLSDSNRLIVSREKGRGRDKMLFIEEGADVEGAILDLREGPIYIGRDACVMPGAMLRGPISLGEHSTIKMGAKIYSDTTFGPYCKIGGEVQNAVVFGYSNKAHDGYLGNAVVGEWCNLGAGVNASNLKNDYSKIRIWNYPRHTFMRTDMQFCGLIMGDHSKAGINVMFNTATVVGVGCNIHGAGFPRVFVPSFSQGSAVGGMTDVPLKKFYEIAERVMSRRGIVLDEGDRRIYERVYEVASRYK